MSGRESRSMRKIERERIEKAARIYASNEDASRALGIAAGSFSRLCRMYQVETPHARRLRRWQEARRSRGSGGGEAALRF
jgi:hypothetical protein